jgi:hypothetical protein
MKMKLIHVDLLHAYYVEHYSQLGTIDDDDDDDDNEYEKYV